MAVIKRLIDLKQVWIRLAAMLELLQTVSGLCQRKQHRPQNSYDDEEKWSCSSSNRTVAGSLFERSRTPYSILKPTMCACKIQRLRQIGNLKSSKRTLLD